MTVEILELYQLLVTVVPAAAGKDFPHETQVFKLLDPFGRQGFLRVARALGVNPSAKLGIRWVRAGNETVAVNLFVFHQLLVKILPSLAIVIPDETQSVKLLDAIGGQRSSFTLLVPSVLYSLSVDPSTQS